MEERPLDGRRVKASARLEEGQKLRVPPIPPASQVHEAKRAAVASKITDEDAKLIRSCVIYKDDDLIAINKPPGLASQGGSGTTRHVDFRGWIVQGISGQKHPQDLLGGSRGLSASANGDHPLRACEGWRSWC